MKKLGNVSTVGVIFILIVALVVMVCVSTFVGAVSIPFDQVVRILGNHLLGIGDISDIRPTYDVIVWELYAPRALLGVIVGMALALSGVVMQAMVQNPLADPYILGISSGASLGATFAILIGASTIFGGVLGTLGVAPWAFIGALAAAFAVFTLSAVGGRMTTTKLVLSGTIIASLCGAFSNLIVYLAPDASAMRDLTFWLMGSLSTTGYDGLVLPAIVLVIALVFFATQLRSLNTMLLGDDVATTLGINLSTLRKIYIIVVSILIGVIVCQCGVIGFVGLIIPHIARALVGTNHWKLMPISVLLGGLFMVSADVVSKTIGTGTVPIGIITAICGAPVFAYIMIKKSYGFGGGE